MVTIRKTTTVYLLEEILQIIDRNAAAAGLSRSRYIERVFRKMEEEKNGCKE